MPISQDDFIRSLTHNKTMAEQLTRLGQIAKSVDGTGIIQTLNSVIDRTEAGPLAEALTQARQYILILIEQIHGASPDMAEVMFAIEKLAHYKVNRRKNELAANYQRRKRLMTSSSDENERIAMTPRKRDEDYEKVMAQLVELQKPSASLPPDLDHLPPNPDGKVATEPSAPPDPEVQLYEVWDPQAKVMIKTSRPPPAELYKDPDLGGNLF